MKADAFTYASEVAMETCKPPSDSQPLASSEVTNRHFVPVRVVATQKDGSTTGVAQIDPETYVWMQTNPTAGIGRDDVVPTSTLRDDVIATPASAKQMYIPPIQDLAEVIRQNQPHYKSEKVDLKAVDERVQRADAYEAPRVDLRSRDEAGRLKSTAIVGMKREHSSIETLEYKGSGTIVTESVKLKQSVAESLQDDRKNIRIRRKAGRPKAGTRPSTVTTGLLVSTLPTQDITPISGATRQENIDRMIEDNASEHTRRVQDARSKVVISKEIFDETEREKFDREVVAKANNRPEDAEESSQAASSDRPRAVLKPNIENNERIQRIQSMNAAEKNQLIQDLAKRIQDTPEVRQLLDNPSRRGSDEELAKVVKKVEDEHAGRLS